MAIGTIHDVFPLPMFICSTELDPDAGLMMAQATSTCSGRMSKLLLISRSSQSGRSKGHHVVCPTFRHSAAALAVSPCRRADAIGPYARYPYDLVIPVS